MNKKTSTILSACVLLFSVLLRVLIDNLIPPIPVQITGAIDLTYFTDDVSSNLNKNRDWFFVRLHDYDHSVGVDFQNPNSLKPGIFELSDEGKVTAAYLNFENAMPQAFDKDISGTLEVFTRLGVLHGKLNFSARHRDGTERVTVQSEFPLEDWTWYRESFFIWIVIMIPLWGLYIHMDRQLKRKAGPQ